MHLTRRCKLPTIATMSKNIDKTLETTRLWKSTKQKLSRIANLRSLYELHPKHMVAIAEEAISEKLEQVEREVAELNK